MEVSSAIIPYGLLDEARIAQIMEVCLVTQQSVRQKAVDLWESSCRVSFWNSPQLVEFWIDFLTVKCEPKYWLPGISLLYLLLTVCAW